MEKQSKSLPQIVKLRAKNFRSIEDLELELSPLTVLVGPNASGKSNVVDVLRFVSDAFRYGLDRAIADRHGIGAIRRWSAKGRYDVEVGVDFQGEDYTVHYDFVLGSKPHGEYQVKAEYFRVEGGGPLEKPLVFKTRNGRLVTPKLESEGGNALGHMISPTDLALRWPVTRFIRPTGMEVSSGMSQANADFEFYCWRMQFFHLFPNEIRQPQRLENPYYLQEHGGNLASVLRQMIKGEREYLADLRDALGSAVPGVVDFQVTQAGGFLVVKLKHQAKDSSGKGAWFDLSQESDGTLRILALLAALFQDPTPSFIAVEEPELTVHPGALAVLADYLREAALRTQVLITTHSPELIDGLPIESLRAVESVDGVTKVGMVAEHQREAVRNELFSPGDLHRIEGLQLSAADRR
jgi:predicted ATPase